MRSTEPKSERTMDETRRDRAKVSLFVGLCLFTLTLAYPFLVYFTMVPGSLASAATVPESALTSPKTATSLPESTQQGVSAGASKEEGKALGNSTHQEQLYRQAAELARYSALVDYLKIFLPIFSALSLAVVGTLGYYFVESRILSAVSATKEDLLKKADNAQESMAVAEKKLSEASAKIEALEESLEALVETRMDMALVSMDHAISLISWRTKEGCDDAIVFGTRNLERLQDLIPKLEARLSTIQETRKAALHGQTERIKGFKISVVADLAYYHAERFAAQKTEDDRNKSLAYARQIVDGLGKVAECDKLHLVDSYLFALSRATDDLTAHDHQQFMQLLNNYRDPLAQLMQGKEDARLFKSYLNASNAFRAKERARGEPEAA